MQEFVDYHTHITSLSLQDIEKMYMCGIRKVISPVQLGTKLSLDSAAIVDVWNGQLDKQLGRCRQFFVKAYSMIGISMVATPRNGLDELLALLPCYLKREDVVAVGEIGFEPGSASNNDEAFQKMLLEEQLKIARQCGVVADIHTPNANENKIAATEKTLDICAKVGIDMKKVVIDHCSDANLKMVLDAGAYAAISVQPWRKISPETAACWVGKFGTERVIIDSDTSELYSDPLAVAKTAFAMRKLGLADAEIFAVCGGNACTVSGV